MYNADICFSQLDCINGAYGNTGTAKIALVVFNVDQSGVVFQVG